MSNNASKYVITTIATANPLRPVRLLQSLFDIVSLFLMIMSHNIVMMIIKKYRNLLETIHIVYAHYLEMYIIPIHNIVSYIRHVL